jgi:hypothetical protein
MHLLSARPLSSAGRSPPVPGRGSSFRPVRDRVSDRHCRSGSPLPRVRSQVPRNSPADWQRSLSSSTRGEGAAIADNQSGGAQHQPPGGTAGGTPHALVRGGLLGSPADRLALPSAVRSRDNLPAAPARVAQTLQDRGQAIRPRVHPLRRPPRSRPSQHPLQRPRGWRPGQRRRRAEPGQPQFLPGVARRSPWETAPRAEKAPGSANGRRSLSHGAQRRSSA